METAADCPKRNGRGMSSLYFVKERARQRVGEIEAAVFRARIPLGPLQFEQNGEPKGEVGIGFSWQEAGAASWLRGRFVVPAEWEGERVGLWIDIAGGEPLLHLNGEPAQALDYNHRDVLLFETAGANETGDFAVECYAPTRGATQTVRAADLVLIDRAAYEYFHDFRVAVQMLDVLDDTLAGQALRVALAQSMDAQGLTQGASAAFYASVAGARRALQTGFFERFPASDTDTPRMTLAGHSHLDLAYLRAIADTRKKTGRTFSTVLRLMDEFPEYHFTQSQAQIYAWTKADYPGVYAKIKQRVADGRWEPTGGMWVEADGNIASGESLIRQILWGNRFFETEFGVKTRVLWLPDGFGILRRLAADHQRVRHGLLPDDENSLASPFNRFPHDTFWWRGIDGTETLTHFVAAPDNHDYHAGLQQPLTDNGITAGEVAGAWSSYPQKAVSEELLNLFGDGDGGGGPTRAMLETGRRLASVSGVPKASFGKVEPFFDRLHACVQANPLTPKWVGELYLEHRGDCTAQGRIKKGNRVGETLLRGAELFASLASITTGANYNQSALDIAWEKILLNQSHDILPGTCVPEAVAQAMQDYETAHEAAGSVLNAALDTIAGRVKTRQNAVVLFNPTDTLRPSEAALVEVPASVTAVKGGIEFSDENGAPLPHQRVGPMGKANAPATFLVSVPDVGAMGYQAVFVGRAGGPSESAGLLQAETNLLENEWVRVAFDASGEIVSLIHKIYDTDEATGEETVTLRETAAPGQTLNALVLYEDKPYAYDGWNVDIFYEDKPYPLRELGDVEITVVETGPVRAALQITRRFLASTLRQTVYLYAHSPRLEFHTTVDWHEQMLLKAVFPADVQSARATYEIAFGSVERPTHRNTSWDVAREVCAHKWADLSEGDWGVSVLSDSKYGWDCHDNVLRLSLLQAGTPPDPQAGHGENTFAYALLPHTGDYRTETVDEAHAFCYPLLSRYVPANPGGDLPAQFALASVNDQGIILETVKGAESGDGYIFRLYEAFNTRGRANLTLGFPIVEAFAVNLVEENPEPVAFEVSETGDETVIPFAFRPFEIKTFWVRV